MVNLVRLISLLVLFQVASAGKVNTLDKDTFAAATEANHLLFALICHPSFPPCLKVYPIFEEIAEGLDEKEVYCAKVNDEETSRDQFPRVSIWKDGNAMTDHRGNFTVEELTRYLKRFTEPPVKQLATEGELSDFTTISHPHFPSIVGYTKEGSDIEEFLFELGSLDPVFDFGVVHEESIAAGMDAKMESIVLYKYGSGADSRHVYPGELNNTHFKQYLEEALLPIFGEFTVATDSNVYSGKLRRPLVLLVSDTKGEEYDNLEAIIPEFTKQLGFTWCLVNDTTSNIKAMLNSRFHVAGNSFPLLLIENRSHHFASESIDAQSKDGMRSWLSKYLEGDLPEVTDPIKSLKKENFESVTKEAPLIIVQHCNQEEERCNHFRPIYAKLALEMSGELTFAKVDTEDIPLKKKPKKGGKKGETEEQTLPILDIFRKGSATRYSGQLSYKNLIKYLRRQINKSVKPLTTLEELETFLPSAESEDGALVVYGKAGSKERKFLEKFAKNYQGLFDFGGVTSASVAEEIGDAMGTIVLFKAAGDGQELYTGALVNKDLQAFLKKHSLPLFGEITAANYGDYTEKKAPIAWLFTGEDTAANEAAMDVVREVAPLHRKSFSFVHLSSLTNPDIPGELSLLKKKFPAFVIGMPHAESFPYDEGALLTVDGVKAFLTSFLENKIAPKLASEPIPDPSHVDDVRILVGTNFEEVAYDKTKDVLVQFYAEGSAEAPNYEKLAAQVKDVKTLVIAKMEIYKNRVKRELLTKLRIHQLPSMKLIKAGRNAVVNCTKWKNLENPVPRWLKFLRKEAHHKFSLSDDNDEL